MSFLSDIEKAEQTITPVAQQLAPGALEEFQKLKQSKLYELAHNKPKLMFYGIYSHGKSTLINALLGRDEAEMDIDPTTSEVHAYECPALNCMLIDTPGFQAQQTHTAIAEEECRKSNLIVFVLQSREFEGDIVWNKLKEVVERGQKACIIINDFDNCLDMPERKERILDKLRSRMQNVFNDPSVVKSVPFCLVNAKSALKARLEHKQKLAAYSRIADVEDLFRSLIKDCNLREVTERSLTQAFGQLIGECRAAAAAKLNDNALSEAEKTLQSLKKYREQFFSRLYTELDYQIKMMFLPELYLSCLSQGDTASLTGEMEQRIARLGTAMETATQREVEALARRFNSRVIQDSARPPERHAAGRRRQQDRVWQAAHPGPPEISGAVHNARNGGAMRLHDSATDKAVVSRPYERRRLKDHSNMVQNGRQDHRPHHHPAHYAL